MRIKLGQKIIDKIRGKKAKRCEKNNYEKNTYIWVKDEKNIERNPKIPGLNVVFKGENNRVIIHGNAYLFKNSAITCAGNNSIIEISIPLKIVSGDYAVIDLIIYVDKGANVRIGKNFTCAGCNIVADNFGADIEIGDDCMLSKDIVIRSTDGHTIIQDGKKVNPGKSVKIGNHCWLGRKSAVLKGAVIPDNSIVSLGAIVLSNTNKSEKGSIFAGIPARVVKTGITWSRDNYDDFE